VPELRHLRAFVAVAEELNFTRAAERLHLGQQAVSKSVGQLEGELGVRLLVRTTREVRLTPAGEALLEDGRRALAAADAAFARARDVGGDVSGTVRVGVSPAVSPAEREEVGRALREGAPGLSVSFHGSAPARS
jgi:DNA-binding transcriptional LysR family regulator